MNTALVGSDNRFVTEYFTNKCHHNKTTLLFQSQNLFPNKGRVWQLNTLYYILFKNPVRSQMNYFFRGLMPDDYKFLLDCYHYSTDQKQYGHFCLSLQPSDPDHLRYRNNIIPSGGTVFFTPK